MTVLVTGAYGFIGKHVCRKLEAKGHEVLKFGKENSLDDLASMIQKSDRVLHLAGVNRPQNVEDFMKVNMGLTRNLAILLGQHKIQPVVYASSIQAKRCMNEYGKSKMAGEICLEVYNMKTKAGVTIVQLSNVFGEECKPNYNSVVATFCYNMVNGLPVHVDDGKKLLRFIYIDDVVEKLIHELQKKSTVYKETEVVPVYLLTVDEVKYLLEAIRDGKGRPMYYSETCYEKMKKTYEWYKENA
jgi:UDP-2-acetamido-2,6-beta-L-arabino-hexul-4-ose reductase